MIAISLGWGVQSFTLAAMSALGDLPRVDVAIHSDTTHERSATYRFAEKWTGWLEDHDIRVVTVRPTRTLELGEKRVKSVQIPAFTYSLRGDGQLRHQCTNRWKIQPMRRSFENLQDVDHVRHAFDFVRPGGVLCSIMSEGPFFRQDRKATEFREWLESIGGEPEKLEPDAFKASEHPTGAQTRLVVISAR